MSRTTVRRDWGSVTPEIEAIAEHALAIIDADGLQALTVRTLAARMDASHGNLYRRFSSRDDLLDVVAARIVASAHLEEIDERGVEWLREAGLRLREAWLAHPHACSLIGLNGQTSLQLTERMVAELLTVTADPMVRLASTQSYLALIVGWILISATEEQQNPDPRPDLSRLPSLQTLRDEVASLRGQREDAELSSQVFELALDQVLAPLHARRSRSAR